MIKVAFRLLCLSLTLLTFGINAQEKNGSDLLPACKSSSKCGFIDRTGKWIIRPRFASALAFTEGLAAISIKKDGFEKYGFIDAAGKISITPQFDDARPFAEGLARFETDSKYGFIDRAGKVVVQPKYINTESFSEGLARVGIKLPQNTTNPKPERDLYKLCFIDVKGELAISCEFDKATSFADGLAAACVSGQCGFIDKSGKWMILPRFADAEAFSEGLAAVKVKTTDNSDNSWGYVNKSGSMMIDPEYYYPAAFSEGLAAVRLSWSKQYGYIDKMGNVVIPFQFYLLADSFSEGLAVVCVSGGVDSAEYGYIDRTGKRISNKKYSVAHSFRNGLAFVSKMNFLAKLDVSNFGGLAFSNAYYIDKSEKVIWKGKY